MLVRRARESDANEAAEVVRRSITKLCRAEYRADPLVLARWLSEMTPANFRRWIGSSDRAVWVATRGVGQVAAVGMVAWRGEILLNFVAPDARFLGASKALVAHMENHLRDHGVAQAALFSTQLAQRFYNALGYAEIGRTESRYGTLDIIEMAKPLR